MNGVGGVAKELDDDDDDELLLLLLLLLELPELLLDLEDETEVVEGCSMTTAVRVASSLAPSCALFESVTVMDMLFSPI